MRSWLYRDTFLGALTTLLARTHRIVAPVRDDDGVVRLHASPAPEEIACGAQPLLSLKKFLLPSPATLWEYRDGTYHEPPPSERPLAAVALPPCDLQALAVLDRALGDDAAYLRERRGLIRIGARCTPDDACRCLAPEGPPPCDLFLADGTLWALTDSGEALARRLPKHLTPRPAAPPPSDLWPARCVLPDDLERRFAALDDDPLWEDPAATCLACGACSAVCPTCYCYDLRDRTLPGTPPWRERLWDNCLFDDFAVVAGGHDFRPGLRARLQFRLRHKLLGFAPAHDGPSCVGCSRCQRHCPVDIGPAPVLAALAPPGDAP